MTRTSSCAWRPPIQGEYKIYVDGDISERRGLLGAGIAVRDGHGDLMAALAKPFHQMLFSHLNH